MLAMLKSDGSLAWERSVISTSKLVDTPWIGTVMLTAPAGLDAPISEMARPLARKAAAENRIMGRGGGGVGDENGAGIAVVFKTGEIEIDLPGGAVT
jgi:hypothetical protein